MQLPWKASAADQAPGGLAAPWIVWKQGMAMPHGVKLVQWAAMYTGLYMASEARVVLCSVAQEMCQQASQCRERQSKTHEGVGEEGAGKPEGHACRGCQAMAVWPHGQARRDEAWGCKASAPGGLQDKRQL